MLILVVDDNMTASDVYREELTTHYPDAKIVVAVTAEMARSIIKRATPDLIILEMSLPYGSGMTVLDFLSHTAISPRVIINTDIDSQTVAWSIKNMGKPIPNVEILPEKMWTKAQIFNALRGSPSLTQSVG